MTFSREAAWDAKMAAGQIYLPIANPPLVGKTPTPLNAHEGDGPGG